MNSTCNQPPHVGQKWPRGWANLGQAGPEVAQAAERDLEAIENKQIQVPFSKKAAYAHLSHKNKGCAAFCSLLRGVCEIF
ncbi:hypothetical protein [Ruegeria sp. HKCCD8929]|uniref:hypothetical protein n=1 Tax=Ruegeria sp. HKCCD8929 TaxID=2683006 RepID=UPI00148A007C|nr:hypothetical protein [Ruegeria sp. HKCCD8929]